MRLRRTRPVLQLCSCLLALAGPAGIAQDRYDNRTFLAMVDSTAVLGREQLETFARNNAAAISLNNIDSLTSRPFRDSIPGENDLLLAGLIARQLQRADIAGLLFERYASYHALHGMYGEAVNSLANSAASYLVASDTTKTLKMLLDLSLLNARLGRCEHSRSALETAGELLRATRYPDSCGFLLESASISLSCGHLDAADEHLRRALAGAASPDDAKDSILLAMIYENLGDAASRKNNRRAQEYYSKAQSIYISLGDREGEFRLWDAFVWQAAESGDIGQARDLLALQSSIAALKQDVNMRFATMHGLCRLETAAGRHEAADSILASMRALIPGDDARQEVIARTQAQIAFNRKDYISARERLMWALQHTHAQYADVGHSQLLCLLARTEEHLNKPDNALRFHKQAIRILETSRNRIYSPADRLNFFAWNLNIYEEAAGFFLRNEHIEDLFLAVERMRSRVFLEDLKNKHDGATADGNADLLSTVARFRNLISRTYLEIETTDEMQWAKLDELQKKIGAYSDTLERLERAVKTGEFEALTYREAGPKLAQPGQAIISYFHVDSSMYAFVLTSRGVRLHDLETDTASLNRMCDEYLRVVSPPEFPPVLILQTEPDPLYEACVLPLKAYLGADDTVLIMIPDGRLRSLPFEALMTEYLPDNELRSRRRYLMDEFRIHYYPSLSAMAALRDIKAKAKRGSAYLGMGDAVYDYDSFIAGLPEKGACLEGDVLRSLDASPIDSIRLDRIDAGGRENTVPAGMFARSGAEASVLLREKAVSSYLKQTDLRDIGYVHLAVHGSIGRLVQYLVFSRLPGQPDHGIITSDQLRNLELNARLAILSACHSADGFAIPGEGVDGLVGATFIAGADAVIASLWKAGDRSSRELMINLFDEMINHSVPPGEALRSAKRRLRQDPDSDPALLHPFYWGAYVIYGE